MKATATRDGGILTEVMRNDVWVERTTCRSCGEGDLTAVISLGNQYLVNFTSGVDFDLPRAPLELVRCSACGLLQLSATVSRDLMYRDYWYRSSVNQTMRDALDDLVRSAKDFAEGGTWLDIGANDGYLLSKVPDTFRRIACEPARTFHETLHKVADSVIPSFFSASHDVLMASKRQGACDVITSAAMFYDVDEPSDFISDIAKVLSPDGVWINQLNDSPTMLKRNAFDAVCHEHLCYYDLPSLERMYRAHGLAIVGVTYNEVNGGSMRVFAKKATGIGSRFLLSDHNSVSAQDAVLFAQRVWKWRTRMVDLLTGPLETPKGIWLYGASTKGSVLLQYLDCPGAFRAIADRNPAKHGLKMAGTWLDVLPEEEMRADRPRFLVALPWAFRDEFVKRERDLLDLGTTMVFPLPNIELVL
jgi:hypothetical protein